MPRSLTYLVRGWCRRVRKDKGAVTFAKTAVFAGKLASPDKVIIKYLVHFLLLDIKTSREILTVG